MKIKKGMWANGSHSIEIDEYEYSKAGFRQVLNFFCERFQKDIPDITSNLDEAMAEVDFGDKKVLFQMDNYCLSISFPSEQDRDAAFPLFRELGTLIT